MLHAAELEGGNGHEVELAEGVGDAGVVLQHGQRAGVEVEDRLAVARHLRGVGLAVVHAEVRPLRSAVSTWKSPTTKEKR